MGSSRPDLDISMEVWYIVIVSYRQLVYFHLYLRDFLPTPWKINGLNIQPSPMKRKENDLPNLYDYVLMGMK